MINVRYERGVELPDHGIWLDPWDRKPFAFVSHAHSDHIGNHAEIITSATTAMLMNERMPGQRIEHVLEFGKATRIRDMGITRQDVESVLADPSEGDPTLRLAARAREARWGRRASAREERRWATLLAEAEKPPASDRRAA